MLITIISPQWQHLLKYLMEKKYIQLLIFFHLILPKSCRLRRCIYYLIRNPCPTRLLPLKNWPIKP